RRKKDREEVENLKKSNATQKLFLQNMSHEIRTPLNAICGFSQILCEPQMREMVTDEEMTKYGQIINSNTELLLTLVNDILDISEMESGKYKVFLEPASPNMICKQAQSTVSYRCPNNIKLYFTTDVPDHMKIMTDSRRCGQVIINFLTNAIKHTREGEIHIHASLTETPGKLTLSVTDTGEGVPAGQEEKIFKRFEKLENSKNGTGLGLSICRNISKALGGEVKLDTSYKNGARFVFIHPIDSM
ncbi:MAG: HAMP domain-containing histidine kinase, partial [Prevotella sp.]|nr:HAMP domain-containing histidine kinase [Prevotella sp.]